MAAMIHSLACLRRTHVPSHVVRWICSRPDGVRLNAVGIQMLSERIRKQLFLDERCANSSQEHEVPKRVFKHLQDHNILDKINRGKYQTPVEFDLPPLMGNNIDEHFYWMARSICDEYFDAAQYMSCSMLPKMPKQWIYQAGWTKYQVVEDEIVSFPVSYPEENCLVFDVEICVKEGGKPVMAVAASPDAWYLWISKQLTDNQDHLHSSFTKPYATNNIPLESLEGSSLEGKSWQKRLVIGHYVSFDRSYISEQYLLKGPKTYFLDTLSLHNCIGSLNRHQRTVLENYKAGKVTVKQPWMNVPASNGLADLHNFYCCTGSTLKKDARDVFVKGSMDDIRDDFQALATYCAMDVKATHDVFCVLWPSFVMRFPSPVTFAGMLEMSTMYVPVDSSWPKYLTDAEEVYQEVLGEIKRVLMRLANDSCQMLYAKRYMKDPWLWALEWSVTNIAFKKLVKKKKKKKQEALPAVEEPEMVNEEYDEFEEFDKECKKTYDMIPRAEEILTLPSRNSILKGYPGWYKKLCEKETMAPSLIGLSMNVVPLLLRMTWDGYPLHYVRGHGWGYLVPGRTDNLLSEEEREEAKRYLAEMEMLRSKPSRIIINEAEEQRKLFPTEVFNDRLRTQMQNENRLNLDWEADQGSEFLQAFTEDTLDDFKYFDTELSERKAKKRKAVESAERQGLVSEVNLPGVWFFKIPHKNGFKYNCGDPLASYYLPKINDGILKFEGGESALELCELNQMTTFWSSSRRGLSKQAYCWTRKEDLPEEVTRSKRYNPKLDYGAIIPMMVTAGTISRRAVDPLWITLHKTSTQTIGSEAKSVVRAPPGYSIVGADVDMQEMWISSILGDSNFAGIHGCTALGWMGLEGDKADKTDMHSKTAETLGIGRNEGKVFNYARAYGAGAKFSVHLLLQFNPRLTEEEASEKIKALFKQTKGQIVYELTQEGLEAASNLGYSGDVDEDGFMKSEAYIKMVKSAKKYRYPRLKYSNRRLWAGGSEAETFNMLESLALAKEPKTPFLGCRLSKNSEPGQLGRPKDFMVSKVNWMVQSSAVDYLHMMLVAMKWMFEQYDIDGRFSLSVHDEVRYIVNSKDRYRAALALHITNLYTRALFAYKLGMRDLPQSVAFFTAVDVDKVLRKEVDYDCKTPSNPHGLEKGHGIKQGEALNIYQTLELTGGKLTPSAEEGQEMRE